VRSWYERALSADRFVLAAAGLTTAAALWFGLGPDAGQLFGIRAITPVLAGLLAANQWRLGADRRLPAKAARFWLMLSLTLLIFTAGMVVDGLATAAAAMLHIPQMSPGETLLYPVGGLFAVVALVVLPTSLRARTNRRRTALDLAIVLVTCAVFAGYYLERLVPVPSWQQAADALVLPVLTLVAGAAVARIAFAGLRLICRPTMVYFAFAAAASTTSVLLDVPASSTLGRFGSMLQVLALAAAVLGVSRQRHWIATRSDLTLARPGRYPPLHGEQWAVFTVERAGRR
jgi:hypothetical protein